MLTIEEKIAYATDRNILCFDKDAKPGEITTRLLDIMKRILSDNYKKELETIFVKPDSGFPSEENGIKIVELDKDYKYYFENLGGWLATGDENLVLGEGGGQYLLGSY